MHIQICRNIETLLSLHQKLTLYMYTCRSHVLRREKYTLLRSF